MASTERPSPSEMSPLTQISSVELQMLSVDQILDKYEPVNGKDDTIKILRAFLDDLPLDGKKNLMDNIEACSLNLKALADSLRDEVLGPLRAMGGQTAEPTPNPRPGREESVEIMASNIVESASRNDQKWLKECCLKRDGQRCIISGIFDYNYVQKNALDEEGEETECTHIIPFAMGHFETDAKARELQGTWVAMRRYFPILTDPTHHFSQENINECRNAMTLHHGLHRNFGKFRIALDPTEKENEYNILQFRATATAKRFLPANNKILFTQHDSRYAMPSPELLRIHAIIAKVLRASGQAEYIDKILQDRDNTGVLATDGSSNVGAFLSMSQLSLIAAPARSMSENVRPGGEKQAERRSKARFGERQENFGQ
ncbi:hypothetical protein DTO063F5_2694 [Paecilomyces variotii]|nr:hypothetical protein DTO063F5_2694 [Paecilomyces variotii]